MTVYDKNESTCFFALLIVLHVALYIATGGYLATGVGLRAPVDGRTVDGLAVDGGHNL